jgi:hypothetical protein
MTARSGGSSRFAIWGLVGRPPLWQGSSPEPRERGSGGGVRFPSGVRSRSPYRRDHRSWRDARSRFNNVIVTDLDGRERPE